MITGLVTKMSNTQDSPRRIEERTSTPSSPTPLANTTTTTVTSDTGSNNTIPCNIIGAIVNRSQHRVSLDFTGSATNDVSSEKQTSGSPQQQNGGVGAQAQEKIITSGTASPSSSTARSGSVVLPNPGTFSQRSVSLVSIEKTDTHSRMVETPSTADAPCTSFNTTYRKGSYKNDSIGGTSSDSSATYMRNNRAISSKKKSLEETESPMTNGTGREKDPKRCCLCWCCCCSCSCLAVKNHDASSRIKDNKQLSSLDQYFKEDGEPPPSLEEIRSWGESFDKLMKCPAGRKVFRDFLKCEYSEENILFWLACEDLKTETNPEVIEEKARLIYEDYISILSPKEVSLDSRVREIINRNMVEPTPHTFDEAQLQIYTLMHRDSYPRFVNSLMYRKLAHLPVPSRKGSVA
ncbi:regulator of G-protein signaling 20-like [Limulus polyphemus]|uniref:Regulator of G-protein signaling 20-like n=1 Tax=Limulus polyphemus TaxID=6850 RepID=A0ABM1SL56_LIMPO|nr:regulator of G-protein signaling 20-like [Limulus polyphemus]